MIVISLVTIAVDSCCFLLLPPRPLLALANFIVWAYVAWRIGIAHRDNEGKERKRRDKMRERKCTYIYIHD